MLDDQRDEVVLIGGERAASRKPDSASVAASRSRPTSERMNAPSPSTPRGAGQILRLADASAVSIASSSSRSVCGQLAISAQLLQSEVIFVCSQIGPRFLAKALAVGPDADAPHVDLSDLAEFVDEVGVDDRALALLEQMDQAADAAARVLQHRQGHVDPPLVTRERVEQLCLLADRRDRQLLQ